MKCIAVRSALRIALWPLVLAGLGTTSAMANPVPPFSFEAHGQIDSPFPAPNNNRIQLEDQTGVISSVGGNLALNAFEVQFPHDSFVGNLNSTPFSSVVSFFNGPTPSGTPIAQLQLSGVLNGQITGNSANFTATVTSLSQVGSLSPPLSINGFDIPPVTINQTVDPSTPSGSFFIGATVGQEFVNHLSSIPEPTSLAVFITALACGGAWRGRRLARAR